MITVFFLIVTASGDIVAQFPSKFDCEMYRQYWTTGTYCRAVVKGRERR